MTDRSPAEKPLWWRRHYELYSDDVEREHPEDVFYQKYSRQRFSIPKLEPTSYRPRGPALTERRSYSQPQPIARTRPSQHYRLPRLDPKAEKLFQQQEEQIEYSNRVNQYKSILSRLRNNDELARKYTGKKFHNFQLLHPRLWFPANQVYEGDEDDDATTKFDSSVFDWFWINKHLYMRSLDLPQAKKWTQDELLTIKLAREAKQMNKKMSKVFDKEKLQLLEREQQIEQNKSQIRDLESKMEKLESQSRHFEKTFLDANQEVIQKLDQLRSEQKLVNSQLLLEMPTEPDELVSGLPPVILPYMEPPNIRMGTDPIWERTRLFLENERDKERSGKLQNAYLNTIR